MSDLYIETRGHGEIPLVLVHGWAMHGGVFEPLAEKLDSRCTLYRVDLPGHGRSRNSTLALDPRACAQYLCKQLPAAVWLGWSMGGLFALTAALEEPDKVLGLAMLSSTPRFVRDTDWPHGMDPDVFVQFSRDLHTDFRATLDRFLALEAMGSAHAREEIRQLRASVLAPGEPDPSVLTQGLDLLEHSDLRARLSQLCMPSAWIAGRRDRLVPPDAMRWSAQQCGGDFTCIEHAGHAAFLGFADDVVEALEPLLETAT